MRSATLSAPPVTCPSALAGGVCRDLSWLSDFSFFNWRVCSKRVHETCAGSTSQWRPLGPASPLVQSGVRAFPPAKSLAEFLLRRDIKKRTKNTKKGLKTKNKEKHVKNQQKPNKKKCPRGPWDTVGRGVGCFSVRQTSFAFACPRLLGPHFPT